eukprot:CAMPEP_0172310158 /NCGR_PEP_ID=MMETSP1058-20130122/11326_1 /TAXON_ID=83371 /ORGANISM="Detonula confervacea, Strain CCMP 353" /LENGTH=140 /DNA_ID=CAMNT_0013022927 /DNA_START=70 /DNA_END=492 /DNA_ORIENTATION=+
MAYATATRAPVVQAAAARYVTARFMSSGKPYAVDAPDGDHDLQDLEESSDWAKRIIDVASVTEDADAITEMHDAVLGRRVFAVDGPDGEHDFEDMEEHLAGVNRIIAQASVLENPDKVRDEQEIRKKSYNPDADFYNAKY